jgi:arylsulfatase A-like enzyme
MNFRPQLDLLVRLALLAALGGCSEPTRPNILIITVDTLRADHLGAFGDENAVTPNLDHLARSSTLFERAAAPMPMTRPSHFSMLTSKYPLEHGVVNNSIALPESALSVAEIFDAAGYSTAAFVGVRLLSSKSGASQGFDHFDSPKDAIERPADEVVQRALAWLDDLPDNANFFLWVHLFDPHIPYAPPAAFRPAAAGDLTSIDWKRLDEIAAKNDGDIPAFMLQQIESLYRGEISYVDHWIGRLLERVEGKFELDETFTIFTADHGECFENGIYFEHAYCLSQSALRIPLLIRYPRDFTPGDRIEQQASILDIPPTILRAAGLDEPVGLSGRPLQDAREFGERRVLLQHPHYQQKLINSLQEGRKHIQSVAGRPVIRDFPDLNRIGLVGANWKYIRGSDSAMLFRLPPDGDEIKNLAAANPSIRREMSRQLRKLLRNTKRARVRPEVDEELKKTLETLGYLN